MVLRGGWVSLPMYGILYRATSTYHDGEPGAVLGVGAALPGQLRLHVRPREEAVAVHLWGAWVGGVAVVRGLCWKQLLCTWWLNCGVALL